jgi:hypothetical protein
MGEYTTVVLIHFQLSLDATFKQSAVKKKYRYRVIGDENACVVRIVQHNSNVMKFNNILQD